ncbi:MAG: xanthine dehydrogenase family protein, partial [bacterium]
MPTVGKSVTRRHAVEMAMGRALYVDDLQMPGMWHGAVVRTSIPHGRVRRVELSQSFDWNRVVLADARDIPGRNCVAMIEDDLPLIVHDVVKHVGEAVMLIAAPTRDLALEARRHVKVEYEEWEPVLTLEDSKAARIKIRGEDNVVARYEMHKGDAAKGFASADKVVEGTYTMGHQEHIYIEPQGMIAALRDDGVFSVVGSLQCPYYVSKALSIIMSMPEDRISVRQALIGGAFGGKEDYPSVIAGYCAVLARKCQRPVKIVYDRDEDIEVSTKRHPAIVRHRTGVRKDGTLVAMDIDFELDAGAYVTLSPVVLSRGFIHSAGPYRCDNVSARCCAYATNTAPNGAFRGFGAPQGLFPIEVHMDRIAEAVGISPLEIRRRNLL